MDIVGTALTAGRPENRVPSLCMMALIVSQFPVGDLQDAAEDILCSFIAEVKPSLEDLAEVRRIRFGK
jgi:hypothetical protein